ncbi:MAG: hypothetical protein CSA55_05670 [Ilumatobacter coccineus]|uniref:NADH-quinone oxidoreductase subunit L n=1 Tax=Ilumatobacter coccineus TaxID=467094 RepID=A0A2G6K722_9ACTN|nr:MAG: hypothetical protein CSA55_05670 [Ilumatobacter coccineus]
MRMVVLAEAAGVSSAGWFIDHAWLIPVFPTLAFFLILLFGRRLPRGGSEIGLVSMIASLVVAIGMTAQWISHSGSGHGSAIIRQWTWWSSGSMEFGLGQHIDGLAVMGLILVAFISTLVQLYSTEYVAGDIRYTHFFAALTLFSAGMLGMVLAPNMVQFILGWEIMGLTSMLLIGHWWEEYANARAGLKAFFTVRVGDMGLLIGTAILLGIFGTLDIGELNQAAANGNFASRTTLMWAAVALFIAAIGKSGQFPLHTWLPDAMAGPTPVSSLLHSSTMVVAGVFLVARIYPIFHVGLEINAVGQQFNLIAVIGGLTVLIAAALAFVQSDIKKVLAYSTVSQLGYMMMGLGVGAWTASVFHIFTHAFFKCALFLIAGSISYTASHHSFDMKKDMGGIWRKMPVSFVAWIVSSAALAGIPFFSGFFSKDEIIDAAKHNGYTWFFWVGVIGAFMTAAYVTRATYLTWFGKPRGAAAHFMGVADDDHHHDDHDSHDDHALAGRPLPFAPTDSPWKLTVPIMVLAILAFGSGYLNAPAFNTHWFSHQVESSIGLPVAGGHGDDAGDHADDAAHSDAVTDDHAETTVHDESDQASGVASPDGDAHTAAESHAAVGPYAVPAPPTFSWMAAIFPGLILVALGIAISALLSLSIFGGKRTILSPLVGLTERNRAAGAIHTFLVNKLYLDHLYENIIVKWVAYPIPKVAYWINQHVLDGVVNGVGRGGAATGRWVYRTIDQRVVDGAVNASGQVASETGHALQPIQSGRVNHYGALLFGAGAVGAIVLILVNV